MINEHQLRIGMLRIVDALRDYDEPHKHSNLDAAETAFCALLIQPDELPASKSISLKIIFIDECEFDKRIPENQRWLAKVDALNIVVTAPSKEQALEEIMTSIRVLIMHENGLKNEKKLLQK